MITTLQEFQERLTALDPDGDDFPYQTDDLISEVSPALASQIYHPILHYFAQHPDSDCGGITSLIHRIEDFYPNYTSVLQETFLASPSWSGVALVNRILNSQLSSPEKGCYLEILQAAITNPATGRTVAELAERSLTRHASGNN